MKTVTFDAICRRAYGQVLKTPLKFKVTADVYTSSAEQIAAGALLTEKEQLKARNTQLKNKARASQQTAQLELAGIVPLEFKEDYDLQVKRMTAVYMANGLPEALSQTMAVAAIAEAKRLAAEAAEDDDDETDDE